MYEDDQDRIWFMANPICKALEYSEPRHAIKQHCEYQQLVSRKLLLDIFENFEIKNDSLRNAVADPKISNNEIEKETPTFNNSHAVIELARRSIGIGDTIFILESDLNKLMINSRMPNAASYSFFILNVILPSIRKYGYYDPMGIAKQNAQDELLASQVKLLSNQVQELIEFKENVTAPKYLPTVLLEAKYGTLYTKNKTQNCRMMSVELFYALRAMGLVTSKYNAKGKMLTDLGRKIIGNHVIEINPLTLSSSIQYSLKIFEVIPELDTYFTYFLNGDVLNTIKYFRKLPKLAKRFV
jgi:prophage antirepressor-like protein